MLMQVQHRSSTQMKSRSLQKVLSLLSEPTGTSSSRPSHAPPRSRLLETTSFQNASEAIIDKLCS